VVHLSPDHESHLADILQTSAKIPVDQVTETVPLEENRVYLIPPNANLDAIDTHLRLSKLEESPRARAPVDHFFRTLAEAHDGNSIGIILSGTGSDGALGIKAIKEKAASQSFRRRPTPSSTACHRAQSPRVSSISCFRSPRSPRR
jgi:two-component system CheB/CheR fusion protein